MQPPPTAQRPSAQPPSHRKPRLPAIDAARCTGCGRCVAVCPPHVLSLQAIRWEKSALLHEPQGCTGCSVCAVKCPFHAITMRVARP